MMKKLKCVCLILIVSVIGFSGNAYSETKLNKDVSGVSQQNEKVTGVVEDNSGTVIGASVTVKGTAKGTVTDLDGAFTLEGVKRGDVIQVSYIGYITQELVYEGQHSLNFKLVENDKTLGEVVVTALGIKRDARALGYAIGSVKGEELTRAGITANPLASLYGKTAGVGVQATSAGPTGGMQIKIRNASSLNGSSFLRPLFVVDGVPIYDKESDMATRGYDPLRSFDYGSGLNDISPEDIESMEILKGAKASVLYGSAGANGVVLITTKSGSKTKGLGVSISYSHEWEQPYSPIKFQNEFGSGENEYDINLVDGKRKANSSNYNFGPKFDGSPIEFFDGSARTYHAYENNYMDLFNSGHSDNVNVSISGGGENGSARLSYTNFDYSGLMPNQTQTKNNLSFNGNLKATEHTTFDFSENLYVVKTKNRRQNLSRLIFDGAFNRDVDITTAMNSYRDKNGYMRSRADLTKEGWSSAFTSSDGGLFDMLWNQNQNLNLDEKIHSITSAKANFQVLPYLSFRLQGGIDYTVTDFIRKDAVLRQDPASGKWDGGTFRKATEKNMIQSYEATVNYVDAFMGDDLKVDAFVGPAYKKITYDKIGVGTMGNLIFPDWYSLANMDGWPGDYDDRIANYLEEGEALYSVFGQATFNWKNKYYFEISGRNDWASTLPKVNRSYFYPGASFTWNFTEDFAIPEMNFGKLRLSWADVGRPASRYYALRSYVATPMPGAYQGVNDIKGPTDLFSGDLKPERKRELEAGFDIRFFQHDRIGLDFAYYNTTFYNQIMAVPLSATTGAQKIRINAGEVNNQGLEFMLKTKPIVGRNYEWSLNLAVTKQWDKVVKLYPGITEITESVNGIILRNAEGERMGQLYARDYARDANGTKKVNGEGLYYISGSDDDLINVGNINPDWYGGLNSNFNIHGDWGALNFAFGIDYRFGGSILSFSNYLLKAYGLSESSLPYRDAAHGGLTWKDQLGRERHDGLILPGVKEDGTPNDIMVSATDYYSSFYHWNGDWQPDEIKENSYIKFREFSLGYTFPQKWTQKHCKVQRLSVALTARNLFYIWKNIDNIDPEAVLGTNSWVEQSSYPTSRMYGFNINVSF